MLCLSFFTLDNSHYRHIARNPALPYPASAMNAQVTPSAADLSAIALSADDDRRLRDLFTRGTPENTQRAWRADYGYIRAWRLLRIGTDMTWPEDASVAMAYLLDHSEDLAALPAPHPARRTAEAMIAAGLRRSLDAPAPATNARRIASWKVFHNARDLANPFDAPLFKEAWKKSRRANARPRARHSAHPVTAEVFEAIIAAMAEDFRGLRDRAIFYFAWATGGRRISEIANLHTGELSLDRYDPAAPLQERVIDIRLRGTKTTEAGETPALLLRGHGAHLMAEWLRVAEIGDGFVFRKITRFGTVSPRGLTADGVRSIFHRRVEEAGYPPGYASPHGLRSGFITEALNRDVPLAQVMRLSLHKSAEQVLDYHDEKALERNPGLDLL